MWAPHEQASQTYSSSRPPSNSPQRWCSRIKVTKAPRIPGMGWKITTTATPCVGCPTTTNPESLSHSLLPVALSLSGTSRSFRRGHKRHAVCCRRYGRCRWSSSETEIALVARRRHEYPSAPPYDVRANYRHAGSGGLYRARGAATGRLCLGAALSYESTDPRQAGTVRPEDVRLLVIAALARGKLWQLKDGRVRAGRGIGAICRICSEPITGDHVEYKVAGPTECVTVHLSCYVVWQEEESPPRV